MARYHDIAADLRRRIASGEWGGVGRQIDTLSLLMAHYEVGSVQTMREAQQVLVADGILLTRQGAGAFIARMPSTTEIAREQLVDELSAARTALYRALDLAEALALPTTTASGAADDALPTRTWAWASWRRCATCGRESGTSRGWVSPEDSADDYDTDDYCVDNGHDVSSGFGLFPDVTREEAVAREYWWESKAHKEEAAVQLLAGYQPVAIAHLRAAGEIDARYSGFDRWSITLTPPTPSANEASE